MENKNVEQYLASLKVVESMLIDGVIDEADYKKSESFLAKKYCIKPKSIFRSNHLLFLRNRGIYMTNQKEVQDGKDNS